jgi:hypothetical protein
VNIENPYKDTPYQVLSVPEIPDVGVLSVDASPREIRAHQVKVLKSKARPPQLVANEAQKLLQQSSRLGYDVFLRSTLNQTRELEEVISRYQQVPEMPLPQTDWSAGLEFWIEPPADQITLQPIEVARLHSYDNPSSDLFEVTFDR